MDQTLIQKVWEHIPENYSREMYGYRLLYSLSNDPQWVERIILMTDEGKRFYKETTSNTANKKLVVFGAGDWGQWLVGSFPSLEWSYYVDNKKNGQLVLGLPVKSFEELIGEKDLVQVVISSRLYYKEIYDQLVESGFSEKNIVNAGYLIDLMGEKAYFDLPYLKHSDEEIFIDGGFYDGKTSMFFKRWANSKNRILAFEPDTLNLKKYKGSENPGGGITLISKGLWDRDTVLNFSATGNALSQISEDGTGEFLEVTSIDNYLKGKKVTFIKLDIEGSEVQALKGSSKTIKTYHPQLAICIYHKTADAWEIPLLLMELNPEYKFYIRHYSLCDFDTVLYAVT